MPSKSWGMVARTVRMPGTETDALDRSAVVLDDGKLRITAMEVDMSRSARAYAYRFDYKGRSVVITGDLRAARATDPRCCECGHFDVGGDLATDDPLARKCVAQCRPHRHREDYARRPGLSYLARGGRGHCQPGERAAARLLPLSATPHGFLQRRLFFSGVGEVRRGDWTIADDGSLYTLPVGSTEIRAGKF